MKISILASGSTGNSIYIEKNNFRCLIDAGTTGKRITENLKKIGRDIKDINHLFVTHEHVDHIKSVGVLARKYNIPIYANKLTWENMNIGQIDTDLKFHFEKDETKDFDGISISSFGVSHDAANPQFYTFESGGKKVSILTDTGYISDKMIEQIKNSNSLVYESNHEENILLSCSYPWKTKQRILSDRGHLSNTDAANYLTKIIGDKTKNIYLAHLSLENNTKELAYMTARGVLSNYGFDCENDINIKDTDPEEPTDLIYI
ncbi:MULTISPECIES: MBL fold metallo-hydrolase [unclassified Gemella]|uniref:MBL fold metallo-hydrolase n=1 Tax=unclassified Gemella TaxID=2624949 RepID=UPI001C041493|nr:MULTISPECIES: MBL fold metallo-hydrolase [unclassified Gemella]MBU0278154.1 MBL fold metallo-hydrolase [Gemella sp. zg-1178]QWQ38890.1 MBL fold metallo-hydrolase [Gemella sp. zg-570]